MLTDKARQFAGENKKGVVTTFRRNGAAQMSIITCGSYRDGVAFTTTADRAKLLNSAAGLPLLAAGFPGGLVGLRGFGGTCHHIVPR